jgi:CHRD domain-containing protein
VSGGTPAFVEDEEVNVRNRLIYAAAVTTVIVLVVGTTAASHDKSGNRGRTHFKLSMDGYQENPSISTTGRGHLELTIDDENQTIDYELSYKNLEGTQPAGAVLASHIHLGALHTNGAVEAFLCGGGGKPPCPSPEGTVTGTIMASDIGQVGPPPPTQGIDRGEPTAFAEFVRAMRAGYTYANVHTTRWPGGEIRGQINDRDRDDDHDRDHN